jgi:hypothetical protein
VGGGVAVVAHWQAPSRRGAKVEPPVADWRLYHSQPMVER